MKITCPGCGVELELPPEAVGRHLLCDVCNTKFEVSLSASRIMQQPKIINAGTKRSFDKKQLDDLAQSKGLKKFYRLFILAPASIKFITIYIFCMASLDSIAGGKPSPVGFLFLLPCFPLLKRKDKAWRALLIACYFSLGASILLVVLWITSYIGNEMLGIAITSAIVTFPIFIALRRHTARQWACN